MFKYLEETYKIDIVSLSAGTYFLYNAYMPIFNEGGKCANRLDMKVEDAYNEVSE